MGNRTVGPPRHDPIMTKSTAPHLRGGAGRWRRVGQRGRFGAATRPRRAPSSTSAISAESVLERPADAHMGHPWKLRRRRVAVDVDPTSGGVRRCRRVLIRLGASDDDERRSAQQRRGRCCDGPKAALSTGAAFTQPRTFRTLRSCQCQRKARSRLPAVVDSPAVGPAAVEAVAAVVYRWVDPLAAAPGGQPAYSACRRNRAPHTPGRSLRPWV